MPIHNFIPPSDDAPAWRRLDPDHAAAIKRWTRELLGLGDEGVVTVQEIACADPGCPLVETVIVVFEETRTRRWKLTRPQFAVTQLMIRQTLEAPPERE